jgi:hypothetical protein
LEEKEPVTAAFSVFYGPADDRNYTKKLQFEKKQTLVDVLLMVHEIFFYMLFIIHSSYLGRS